MLAGNMLASSASDRSYWASMTASARAVSRSANHTVTTTITQAEMVVTTKPVDWAQAGCSPVSRGTRNSSAMIRPAADGRQACRQHDVFDPEQQHHEAGADQEEELSARTGAHVPAAGEDRDVGCADKGKRRNQFPESL